MPDFEQVCHRLFSDSAWLPKCLLGALLMAIPILNFCAFGYLGQVVTSAARGEEFALPEWREWRQMFLNGILFFAIFLGLAGGLFLLALLLSLPFRIWAGLFGFIPWTGLLVYLPFMPAVALAPPLVAAGWYRYVGTGQPLEAFRLPQLFRLIRGGGVALILPTLAFVGFLFIGLPLFPLAFFVGGLVVFYFYSSIFCHAEGRRDGFSDISFSVL
jgi:hypothetical protein